MTSATLHFSGETELETLQELNAAAMERAERERTLAPAVPFREIFPLDEDARSWTNMFSMMDGEGILVFDANGDDLPDIYVTGDGQNWTRPTDERGVLVDKPRLQANMLYLHQGNDVNGDPTYASIKELVARGNGRNEAAELLVEGYLFPRQSASDPTHAYGRASTMAVSADMNGDGRPDLLVGNKPPGMVWSHESTREFQAQFIDPIGRNVQDSARPLTPLGQYMIPYEPRYSLYDKRRSARGEEFEGANSLYLNLGDTDGDGIPEWRDASRESKLEGQRPTTALVAADFDLDGDLDVYETNRMDEDYWMGASNKIAGGRNCLYVNQLAETGRLEFVERGSECDVDGLYDEDNPMPDYYRMKSFPLLPQSIEMALRIPEGYKPEYLTLNGQQCEPGQMSWATIVQDVDLDGLPDIWVGNDMGWLRLYKNMGDLRFEQAPHARSEIGGNWMSFAPGDFNGDGYEDLWGGNSGGAVLNASVASFPVEALFDPPLMVSVAMNQFMIGKHDGAHCLIDGSDIRVELNDRVEHSVILPPDVTIPSNIQHMAYEMLRDLGRFDVDTMDPYEFAWGSATFDVQNDGLLDLYWVGGMATRGGSLRAIGVNPGRLLVNAGADGSDVRFIDETAEHHIFNIELLDYESLEDGYVSRRAPAQGWNKRDTVFSYDRSVWSSHGPMISERVTNQDMLRCSESGRAAIAADLDGDGYEDILVRNKGGYDSLSPDATNLMANIDGQARVIPTHHYSYPQATNYESGATRIWMNEYSGSRWLKVRLIDDGGTYNRDAIGARVLVNDRWLRVMRAGEGSFVSNRLLPLHFGLGDELPRTVEVHWPDAARTVTLHELTPGTTDTTVTLRRSEGVVR